MKLRKEEYVPLAEAVLNSFKRDQGLIEAANHTFSADYLKAFQSKIEEVRTQELSAITLQEQKQVTQALYQEGEALRIPLKLFGIVEKKAGFNRGFTPEIITMVKNRNAEGALLSIKELQQFIAKNQSTLEKNGLHKDLTKQLEQAYTELTRLSNQQTQLMKDRKLIGADNQKAYDELYQYVSEICEIGKIVLEGTPKANEYNISAMLNKLHVIPAVSKTSKEDSAGGTTV